ncbi:magnesium-translocating P-type ATPase (plasmid) [Azospirillum brasilense]|uniref:Magnesium-transporting ATPase, P-type 1 n=1 Tax=Azospirillum brasilense TaxID=192 RepID=A0A4D8QVP8_AZOBR|nr:MULTISPECIES: magnesium-translocating P-type ATPase [Azospirillum]MDW7556770.1 magnesium-translocating P-type ATPase [Azospirillum brasilense]MDW7594112.1 magnesium-translocating P-type ATPase [Azospirillum brasilense]MDW7632659.1 magnesium-translocating P-type ATPase [Azospirillum brasilense]MDX5949918.1 magnesium-translocating P-type ATPase [Azospirillum brasilense]NUB23871.1 magnesium-translocating P-type ATPase [Azospirillum brasilense]
MENDPDSVALASQPLDSLLAGVASTAGGLSGAEADARLTRCGSNDLSAVRRRPLWLQFLDRLHNPLLIILLLASGFSAMAGDFYSFAIVVTIVFVSVVLDFVQEVRANNTIEDLRRSVALRARVLRDGQERELPVERLVPGDVVQLVAGDLVPADARLIEARDLFVNQALLTGEPYPTEKHVADLPHAADPSEATNTLFMGTSVISGTGRAVILRTGRATLLGAMAHSLKAPPPPTDFEIGVRHFGLLILRVTVFLVLFVLLANVLFHRPWLESLMFAVALAVGLTPELLPMVVTVTLARGALRLAERKVIVKRLTALHNLGAMDVLCTDKTGTLTEARIRLVRHIDAQGEDSDEVFRLAWLNSRFESGIRSPLDDAILEHGQPDAVDWHKLDEVPFDFERRRVSVLLERGGQHLLIVKGAPEDVLRLSTHYEPGPGRPSAFDIEARARVRRLFEQLGDDGFRVLGIASRVVGPDQREARVTDETELVFAGFAAFLDPPKADAAAAVHALSKAGVAVKILTGDNDRVTRHVCRDLGIPVTGLISGDELRAMSEEALRLRLAKVNVFCRLSPPQKQRVLLALKQRGHAVGFLGDGINDAAALHAADVGISVDGAADVAKDAASLILLEHDLSVIHGGVLEGRRTVENVTKYILMGSSSNFGNMLSMAGAALVLPFLPMLPIQVLLNNLLYDASEIGIPFDRVDPETIVRPVRWNMDLIRRFMLILGPVSSLFDFLTFYALLTIFGAGEALFQTGWFVESLATQALIIFVIRTRRSPLVSRPHPLLAALSVGMVLLAALIPLSPLGPLFGFVSLPLGYFIFLAGTVAAYLILAESIKRLFYRWYGRQARRGAMAAGRFPHGPSSRRSEHRAHDA